MSIDSDSLRSVDPLLGVIFLFKYRRSEFEELKKKQQQQLQSQSTPQPQDGHYDEVSGSISSMDDPSLSVFFAHQVIQNACATQAVLSLLMNLKISKSSSSSEGTVEGNSIFENISLGPELTNFKEFVDTFDPELRGEAISNSDTIRAVHNSFSRPSSYIDDEKPQDDSNRDEENDGLYHFISYLPINGKLYELDGLHPYPIIHTEFASSSGKTEPIECTLDNFPELLSQVLSRRIARAPDGDLRFNLLGLTQDKRILYQELGDVEGLQREQEKREMWRHENLLRRANYTPLITQLIRGIISKKQYTEESWAKDVIENAQKKSYERSMKARNREID